MEIEAKYALPDETAGLVLFSDPRLAAYRTGETRELRMDSAYYADAAGRLAAGGFTLRLRRENGVGVCCLKWKSGGDRGAVKVRGELECPAEDIGSGVRGLLALGAPEGFADAVRGGDLSPFARVRFLRRAVLLSLDGMEAELALDCGVFGSAGIVPFCELEVEWKAGPLPVYEALLRELEEAFALEPQPLSKLARAIRAESVEGV